MTQANPAPASALSELLDYSLAFRVLEIGARPIGDGEPFHALLDLFPQSRIAALEVDAGLCDQLNRGAPHGMRFYTCALGRSDESRTLYEATHPMCDSLYEPDARYADSYHDLDVMRLKSTREVSTTSLDAFVRESGIGPLDFIKLDIQGAELEVLQGGAATLAHVLAVVSEVEFVPLYKGQPLYGDLDAYLRRFGFTVHRFLNMAGRTMKPLLLRGSAPPPAQIMWADALFTRDPLDIDGLAGDALLKLAVLLDLYGSHDTVHYLLCRHDERSSTHLAPEYLEAILAGGQWQKTAQ